MTFARQLACPHPGCLQISHLAELEAEEAVPGLAAGSTSREELPGQTPGAASDSPGVVVPGSTADEPPPGHKSEGGTQIIMIIGAVAMVLALVVGVGFVG